MKTEMKIAMCLAIIGCMATAASATTIYRGAIKSGRVGDGQAGASYEFIAKAYACDHPFYKTAHIYLAGEAQAQLLGNSAQLTSLKTQVESFFGAGSFMAAIKACGYNVVNYRQVIPVGATYSYSKRYSATFLKSSATFWVSFIPVTFNGNVGGGASMDLTCRMNLCQAEMNGGPKAWGSTKAKAGIGIAGYTLAGVGTTAKLMDSYLKSNARIGLMPGATSQNQGKIALELSPLNADLWFKVLGFSEKVISRWSAASRVYTLATLP